VAEPREASRYRKEVLATNGSSGAAGQSRFLASLGMTKFGSDKEVGSGMTN
jgi:hypothetical protein